MVSILENGWYSKSVFIQLEGTGQLLALNILFGVLYKVLLAFGSVLETVECLLSNEEHEAVISCITVCF